MPDVDIAQIGTRQKQKVLPPAVRPKIRTLRHTLAITNPMPPGTAEEVSERMERAAGKRPYWVGISVARELPK